ncbi:MAG: haloacid dehalogenase type II [Terracidiphilus sp.]|jgi:2-haloacid dehalogenase
MNQSKLEGIKACVFDAYGTLFDYASAALRYREMLGEKREPFTRLWREKQLQYTWLRSIQNRHVDFWQVTGDALDFAMEALGVTSAALRENLMNTYLALDAFPEVAETLRRLRAMGLKTAILSNGTPDMLHSAVVNAHIEDQFDAVISVEEAGVYKPHPSVYQLAVDHLSLDCGEILFLSSNAWDAYAASAFGMRVVWCNRYGQNPERLPGRPDHEIKTLAELPELIAGPPESQVAN